MGSTRTMIKISMVLVLILWVFMWFMKPLTAWQRFWQPVLKHTTSKSYAYGAYIVLFAAPIVFVGFIGALGFHHNRKHALIIKKSKLGSSRYNPVTYPLFTKWPLSNVSAADFIFLSALIIFTVYTFTSYYIKEVNAIDIAKLHKQHEKLWHKKLETAGTMLGVSGMFCIAILFFPVTRGSAILKLFNIPFEHAVKFHIWIAVLMLTIWTTHGTVYIIYWIVDNRIEELWSWHKKEISGLSGLLALIIGLTMWFTSLGWVRKRSFESFYYTHHLYIPFILFYGLHIGDKLYTTALGGALLFFASRLMRFVQSRQTVDVMSARILSNESVELVFAKQPASFVFLNIPAISRLEWHPFTVTSSSDTETDRLALLVKKNGDWTSRVYDIIQTAAKGGSPLQLEAGIEGPYSHNMDYLSRYQVLIFIAGGSGISPFISMLKEILYSVQEKLLEPPQEVNLIYIVKKTEELHVLDLVCPSSLCPGFADSIKINVQAYVTREEGVDLEENKQSLVDIQLLRGPSKRGIHAEPSPNSVAQYTSQQLKAIYTPLAANGIVEAAVILASFIAFLFFAGIIGRFYIYKQGKDFARSVKGFLAFLEMILGVLVGGGMAAFFSRFFFKQNNWTPQASSMITMPSTEAHLKPDQIHYGGRPDFQSVFSEIEKHTTGLNVGVFACGPLGMQEDVAVLCQEYREHKTNATYNYHSLSFDL